MESTNKIDKSKKMVKIKFNKTHCKGAYINGKFTTNCFDKYDKAKLKEKYIDAKKNEPEFYRDETFGDFVARFTEHDNEIYWFIAGEVVEIDEQTANYFCNKKIGQITIDGKYMGDMKFYFENNPVPKNLYKKAEKGVFDMLFKSKTIAEYV